MPAPKPKKKVVKITPPKPETSLDPESMAKVLEANPDYRVLRRLVPKVHFDSQPLGPVTRILVLDTETTGLNHGHDKIIELAMLRVDVDLATGLPVGQVAVYDGLEDPGVPISDEIVAITGISSDMVKGQRLDELQIGALMEGVDLVIAHNAGFDRPFCESRISGFSKLPWGCSFVDIDWKKEGHGSSKLEYLARDMGLFYEAHRAEVDCHALLAVLTKPLSTSGQTGLAKIIQASKSPSYTLQATNAPFDAKDLLKSRAYRWNAEQRVWYTRIVDQGQLMDEFEWLKSAVYAGRSTRVQVEKQDADVKYSSRAGVLSMQQI